MDYTQVTLYIKDSSEENTGIVCGFLADIGFEGFHEEDNQLFAYIPEQDFNQDTLDETLSDLLQKSLIEDSARIETIESKNWNAVWEQNYFQPIAIKDKLYVRGSFHPKNEHYANEIVIDPKMSFGTGHHQTTKMILESLMEADLEEKSVMDMGTGTGILAIYAAQKKAAEITAVDIDQWSVENAEENFQLNGFGGKISVHKGDVRILPTLNGQFDIFIANINLGVLLQDIEEYTRYLAKGGELFLSGFLISDIDSLVSETTLDLIDTKTDGEWAMLRFRKN